MSRPCDLPFILGNGMFLRGEKCRLRWANYNRISEKLPEEKQKLTEESTSR